MPDFKMPSPARVYFLGAGASKAYYPTFPLAGDLTLRSLLDSKTYIDLDIPHGAIENIRKYLVRSGKPDEFTTLPIEVALASFVPGLAPEYPFENVSFCMWKRFHIPESYGLSQTLVRWLRRVRAERSATLTTNYDTVIEWALANTGTGEFPVGALDLLDRDASDWLDFGIPLDRCNESKDSKRFSTPPERSILYLKLHGSTSWTYCSGCNKYSLGGIYENAAEHASTGFDRCSNCPGMRRLNPVIVPMTLQKDISGFAIDCIWQRAKSALSSAHEIVFAGFSLNRADSHIRDLLADTHASAKTRRVMVVDPSGEPTERYKAIYGDVAVPILSDWKTYLATVNESPVCAPADSGNSG